MVFKLIDLDLALEEYLPDEDKDEAVYELPIQDRWVFGSSLKKDGIDFTIWSGRGVSRKHCEIFRHQGRYYIKDLGSSFGTFVNGYRIDFDTPLNNGAKIKMGGTDFRVEIS